MNRSIRMRLVVVIAFACRLSYADGTGFNYQGQVKQGGAPMNVPADLVFRAYDAETDGNVVGLVELLNVEIENGLFTVELDFGEALYAEQQVWLEVSVRVAGSADPYRVLQPRQKLSGAPFAHFAERDGKWARTEEGITNLDSTYVGINRDGPVIGTDYFGVHSPSLSWGGMYISSDSPTGRPFYGYNVESLYIFHWVDGQTGKWHLRSGGPDRLTVQNDGNVGIGNTNPESLLHVGGSYTPSVGGVMARVAGPLSAQADLISDGGNLLSRSPSGTNVASLILDSSAGSGGSSWFLLSHANGSPYGAPGGTFSLYGGGGHRISVDGSGRVGIGTVAPELRLHVAGGTDVGPSGGGYFQTGNGTGRNIAMDDNEIMARDNGAVSDLYLQNEGGNVLVGTADESRLGVGTTEPLALMHARDLSLSIPPEAMNSEDVVIESNDATLSLYSSAGGSWGSILSLMEMDAGSLVDNWSIARRTTGGGGQLRFTHGSNAAVGSNNVIMSLDADAQVEIADTIELYATEDGADGAQMRLRDAGSQATFEVDAEEGSTGGAVQFMRNSLGTTTIELDADQSDDAAIYLDNSNGSNRVAIESDMNSAGYIRLRGANGTDNVVLSRFETSNEGFMTVCDSAGGFRAGAFVETNGDGVIFGDVKSFRAGNPRDANTEIWYASVEGPEAAAYVRGTASLVNGTAEIELPTHFQDVAVAEGMTVQLTPRSAASKGLAVVERSLQRFVVGELFSGSGNYAFDWEVKAVRKGFEDYEVIRLKRDVARLENLGAVGD